MNNNKQSAEASATTSNQTQIEIGMNATFNQSSVRVVNAHDLYAVD